MLDHDRTRRAHELEIDNFHQEAMKNILDIVDNSIRETLPGIIFELTVRGLFSVCYVAPTNSNSLVEICNVEDELNNVFFNCCEVVVDDNEYPIGVEIRDEGKYAREINEIARMIHNEFMRKFH